MKTLINKDNPAIRVTAPEFKMNESRWYTPDGELSYIKENWTLVEEKPMDLAKAAESYSENRTGGIILDDEVKAFKAGAKWMREQMKGDSKCEK